MDVLLDLLGDIPAEILKLAIKSACAEPGRAFAPAVGEIRAAALELSVSALGIPNEFEAWAEVLEKDYALSYLLAGIAQTPSLGEKIVLKGGSALEKLYYPGYRFSEDLDFSTLKPGILPKGNELI